MNIYDLSRKDLTKLEKEFSKTPFGQKVRLPILISLLCVLVWMIVVVGLIIVSYNCYMWMCGSGCTGYYGCYPLLSGMSDLITPCVVSFSVIVAMCVFSASAYNRELRKFIASK